jgi:hypothetical protein
MPSKALLSTFFSLLILVCASGQSLKVNNPVTPSGPSFTNALTGDISPGAGRTNNSAILRTNAIIEPRVTTVTQVREIRKIPEKILPDNPSVWRALVPGAGQFQLDEKEKGFILAGFFAVSAISSIALFVDAYNLKDKSIRSVQSAEQLLDVKSRHVAMSNAQNLWDQALGEEGAATALVCVAAAVWAYSAFDYIYTFKRTKALEISFRDDRLIFRYRIRI